MASFEEFHPREFENFCSFFFWNCYSFFCADVPDVNVVFAKTLTYQDGKNSGGAIVTLETAEQAQAVIEKLNQVTLDGRNILATVARSKEQWEQSQASKPPREQRGPRQPYNRDQRGPRGPRQPRQPRDQNEQNEWKQE